MNACTFSSRTTFNTGIPNAPELKPELLVLVSKYQSDFVIPVPSAGTSKTGLLAGNRASLVNLSGQTGVLSGLAGKALMDREIKTVGERPSPKGASK